MSKEKIDYLVSKSLGVPFVGTVNLKVYGQTYEKIENACEYLNMPKEDFMEDFVKKHLDIYLKNSKIKEAK